jgi:Rrf2 family protein
MAYGLAFTQAIYVLVFVGDKARKDSMDYVPTPLIAETLNIPKPSVVKILQLLSQEGLVETGAGKNGGVRLTVPPETATLLRVFNAIEGKRPLFRLDHSLSVDGPRPRAVAKDVEDALTTAENALHSTLQGYSISDFLGTNR